jgi:hypothetical protein
VSSPSGRDENGADQHVGGGAGDDAEDRAAPPQLQRDGHADREDEAEGAAAVVDINATDRQTMDDFEAAIVAFDEVIAVRRL